MKCTCTKLALDIFIMRQHLRKCGHMFLNYHHSFTSSFFFFLKLLIIHPKEYSFHFFQHRQKLFHFNLIFFIISSEKTDSRNENTRTSRSIAILFASNLSRRECDHEPLRNNSKKKSQRTRRGVHDSDGHFILSRARSGEKSDACGRVAQESRDIRRRRETRRLTHLHYHVRNVQWEEKRFLRTRPRAR